MWEIESPPQLAIVEPRQEYKIDARTSYSTNGFIKNNSQAGDVRVIVTLMEEM